MVEKGYLGFLLTSNKVAQYSHTAFYRMFFTKKLERNRISEVKARSLQNYYKFLY